MAIWEFGETEDADKAGSFVAAELEDYKLWCRKPRATAKVYRLSQQSSGAALTRKAVQATLRLEPRQGKDYRVARSSCSDNKGALAAGSSRHSQAFCRLPGVRKETVQRCISQRASWLCEDL